MKKLRIGYREYKVEKLARLIVEGKEVNGSCDKDAGLISLNKGIEGWVLIDTMIHEIFHGIYHDYYIKDEDDEEDTIAKLSSGLTQIIKDNPALIRNLVRIIQTTK